jgi:hypothetical protein
MPPQVNATLTAISGAGEGGGTGGDWGTPTPAARHARPQQVDRRAATPTTARSPRTAGRRRHRTSHPRELIIDTGDVADLIDTDDVLTFNARRRRPEQTATAREIARRRLAGVPPSCRPRASSARDCRRIARRSSRSTGSPRTSIQHLRRRRQPPRHARSAALARGALGTAAYRERQLNAIRAILARSPRDTAARPVTAAQAAYGNSRARRRHRATRRRPAPRPLQRRRPARRSGDRANMERASGSRDAGSARASPTSSRSPTASTGALPGPAIELGRFLGRRVNDDARRAALQTIGEAVIAAGSHPPRRQRGPEGPHRRDRRAAADVDDALQLRQGRAHRRGAGRVHRPRRPALGPRHVHPDGRAHDDAGGRRPAAPSSGCSPTARTSSRSAPRHHHAAVRPVRRAAPSA